MNATTTSPNPYRLLTTPLCELSEADIKYICDHKAWLLSLKGSALYLEAIKERRDAELAAKLFREEEQKAYLKTLRHTR